MEYNTRSKIKTSEQFYKSKHDLVRNQLSSVVREGTEAGVTVMEQGVNLLANFPLFTLQKYADILENKLISRESLF